MGRINIVKMAIIVTKAAGSSLPAVLHSRGHCSSPYCYQDTAREAQVDRVPLGIPSRRWIHQAPATSQDQD